jgi:hypothetical protein
MGGEHDCQGGKRDEGMIVAAAGSRVADDPWWATGWEQGDGDCH